MATLKQELDEIRARSEGQLEAEGAAAEEAGDLGEQRREYNQRKAQVNCH
jgi:hypothetical protein